DVLAVVRRLQYRLLERRLVNGLAGVLVQGRLGIERLQVADTAQHEEPDDALRLRLEMRLPVGRLPRLGADDAVLEQHGAEGEPGEAHADIGQKGPPADSTTAVRGVCDVEHGGVPQRIVTKSLWLNNTWIRLSRARWAGSVDGGVMTSALGGNGVSFAGSFTASACSRRKRSQRARSSAVGARPRTCWNAAITKSDGARAPSERRFANRRDWFKARALFARASACCGRTLSRRSLHSVR